MALQEFYRLGEYDEALGTTRVVLLSKKKGHPIPPEEDDSDDEEKSNSRNGFQFLRNTVREYQEHKVVKVYANGQMAFNWGLTGDEEKRAAEKRFPNRLKLHASSDVPDDEELEACLSLAEDWMAVNGKEWKKSSTRVYLVFFVGKSGDEFIKFNVHPHIRSALKSQLCVVCGNSPCEADHKNDLFYLNEKSLTNPAVQLERFNDGIRDFQALCQKCNKVKRSLKKKMLDSKERPLPPPSVRKLGRDFWKGTLLLPQNYNEDTEAGKDAMVGSYWHDPEKFMEEMRKLLITAPAV
jgi:hypothetical protein